MRFAGSRMENFMDDNRPDYGQMGINQDNRETEFVNKSNEAQAYVGSKGITTAGEVEAAGILADAEVAMANAQSNAAMMETLGGIGSSFLGGIKPGGGGGVGGTTFTMSSGSTGDWTNINSGVLGSLGY